VSTASPPGDGVVAQVGRLCEEAAGFVGDGPAARELTSLRDALDGPLRVAIAGRVKAGKSTLLNALVGERLAPTDAGECTRLVTTYREALGYQVVAIALDGAAAPVAFRRDDGSLKMDLAGRDTASIDHLEVGWPSAALREVSLIDTPGLASINDANSRRTHEFLTPEEGRPGQADAVIYLMRHLHRSDADFLDAFLDRSVGDVSPVNTVAVLSRADEIGACRLDAMESAGRIAGRLRSNEKLRALCSTVVPLAGLLAETGQTLREHEAASLRALAALPADQRASILLSVDRFCDPGVTVLPVELRRALVDRLGMFGLRLALTELAAGRASTGADLSALMVRTSGLSELRQLIGRHFLPRAQVLRARSTLTGLRKVARDLAASDPVAARELESRIERISASAHEFAELRLAHLVLSGAVRLPDDATAEVERMVAVGGPATRVGLDGDASPEAIRAAAVQGIERWRAQAEDPLTDRLLADVCEVMARSYEGIYGGAAGR
jgi:50S ribosome-binding GTPase